MTVLLVEDTMADAVLTKRKCSEEGIQLHHASSLEDAIDYAQRNQPEAVLLDLGIPPYNGVDTYRRFTEAVRQTPVVVLTSQEGSQIIEDVMAAGAEDFLSKDATPKEIHRAVSMARLRAAYAQTRDTLHSREERLKHAQEMDRLKTRLLNVISHELNTPLTPMMLQVQLMRGRTESAADERSLGIIQANIDRLRALIQDVTIASSTQAGRLDLHPSTRSLPDVIAFWQDKGTKRVQREDIPVHMPDDVPDVDVWADVAKTSFAIEHLVANALEAARKEVTLSFESDDQSVTLHVDDDGEGVPESVRDFLFEAFATSSSHLDFFEGAGLGLYLARRIARFQGGDLIYVPRPEGSRFSLRFRRE